MNKIMILILTLCGSFLASAQTAYLDFTTTESINESYSGFIGDREFFVEGTKSYNCTQAVVERNNISIGNLIYAESTFTISRDLGGNLLFESDNSGRSFILDPINLHEFFFEDRGNEYFLKANNSTLLLKVVLNGDLVSGIECIESLLF